MAKLIGTDPNQVPTNADLGTMAYQDKDNLQVGRVLATSNGEAPAEFDRLTSNGDIAVFRKNGSQVGSIGSSGASSRLTISGAVVGLYFGGGDILPTDSSGAVDDNAVNLGSFGVRFKDLYLSGGVYLGGVGSANNLNDYEEGTFNPTVAWQSGSPSYSANGGYTKVGNIVTVRAEISVTASGGSGIVQISNLPFSSYSETQAGTGAERGNTGKGLVVWVDSSSTRMAMRYYDYTDVGTASGDTIVVSAAYEVA